MTPAAALQERFAVLRDRFEALPPREQVIVGIGGVALAVLLAWLVIWLPVHQWRDARKQALADGEDHAVVLEHLAAMSTQSAGNVRGSQGRSVSLLSAVDMATHEGGLPAPPNRMQPEGDSRVQVWFTDIPFEALVRWIAYLHAQFGIDVDTASVEHKPVVGVVDAHLALVRK